MSGQPLASSAAERVPTNTGEVWAWCISALVRIPWKASQSVFQVELGEARTSLLLGTIASDSDPQPGPGSAGGTGSGKVRWGRLRVCRNCGPGPVVGGPWEEASCRRSSAESGLSPGVPGPGALPHPPCPVHSLGHAWKLEEGKKDWTLRCRAAVGEGAVRRQGQAAVRLVTCACFVTGRPALEALIYSFIPREKSHCIPRRPFTNTRVSTSQDLPCRAGDADRALDSSGPHPGAAGSGASPVPGSLLPVPAQSAPGACADGRRSRAFCGVRADGGMDSRASALFSDLCFGLWDRDHCAHGLKGLLLPSPPLHFPPLLGLAITALCGCGLCSYCALSLRLTFGE